MSKVTVTSTVQPQPPPRCELLSHESSLDAEAASLGARGAVLAVGVVACLAVAVALVVTKLDDALGLFDQRADTNASFGYEQRAHTYPGWSPAAGRVLEDARLWMPEDAYYRVVETPGFDEAVSADFSRDLLLGFLLPRRPTDSESAEWIICYGCVDGSLGGEFELLSGVEGGPSFGRLRR